MLQYGETALQKAAVRGHMEVVKILVKYGAAVDIRNKVWSTYYADGGTERVINKL